MGLFDQASITKHVARICDSDAFRAAPKLSRVLQFLATKTLEGGDDPLGQRVVAEEALGLNGEAAAAGSVAARMQVGRLRKQLEAYYEAAGRDEPIRIEIPKRNYRLRFRPAARDRAAASPRAKDRATLGLIELTDLGVGEGLAWLPRALTSELLVAFGPFLGLAVSGPLAARPIEAAAHGIDYFLIGGVRAEGETVHVSLQLLDGHSELQAWARSFSFAAAGPGALPAAGLAALRRIAEELADETGLIACEQMRQTAARPVEGLSVRETTLATWRYLMTGLPEDFHRARAAAAKVAATEPDSAAALVSYGMMELAAHLADPRPAVRCPSTPVELLERAHSLSPGDPWVMVHRGFALWIAKEPLGIEAICRSLDGRPASGSFSGMLGSLMVVSAVDLDRGEQLLGEAIERAPQPLFWYCHHAALAGFLRGDFEAMRRSLARIAVRTDPFSLVLRMVLAAIEGDRPAAGGLAMSILEVFPEFPLCGEVMLRRLLHDEQVDAIAAAVRPLGLGWFE